MNRFATLLARSFATVLSLALVNMSVPMGGMTHLAPDPNAPKPAPKVERSKAKVSRPLSAKQMRSMQGKMGKNPYFAGGNKWDVNYKGVNMMTGSLTLSGTDLTFEGGYGIPVNVTRSYNSNDADEGPMGEGWTLSVDIRNTAGGLLKSSSAPVRSVPVSFKERPIAQNDPRIPDVNEPVEAVIATDAGGLEETIQKDADGILTTPTWDKNRNVSEYESVTVGSSLYQILKRNIVTTPEGTVYVYEKKGSYPSGTYPWDDPYATPTPANVLKISTATDRHGNVTTYNYGSTDVTFNKSNGQVSEKRLESIEMPNGHEITFTWGNGTNAPTNRIRTASDGVRTVTYGYTSGLLTSVTTPAGKVTTYGYGTPWLPSGWGGHNPGNLLNSVTDPRGLVTSFGYAMWDMSLTPYNVWQQSPAVYKIVAPNGNKTYFMHSGSIRPPDVPVSFHPVSTSVSEGCHMVQEFDSADNFIYRFHVEIIPQGSTPQVLMRMQNGGSPGVSTNPRGGPWVDRYYDVFSQNLLTEESASTQIQNTEGTDFYNSQLQFDRHLVPAAYASMFKKVTSTTSYNYLGNPLSKTVVEAHIPDGQFAYVTDRTATIGYAYWGREKYYQQKAVKDPAGRASFTDYFDWNAAQGKKGQTYRVYDEKRADFSDKTVTNWRNLILPTNSAAYTAEFDYDSKGRATDVWKLQKTTTSPWTYVQTKTTYGADSSPTWGAATQVVEDYGSGKINRTTSTLAYDSIGRAIELQDASGKVFETNYDLDGVVQSVFRTDSSLNQMVVGYTYGTSGLLNGAVTQLEDGLSGVVQDFTYISSGGGKGRVASVTETNGSHSYSTSYTYNDAGDRLTATYATPNGTTSYKYLDYMAVGGVSSPSRVFQTLNKLDGSGNLTGEEFHYAYDSSGRLAGATFAQTPQAGGGAPSSAPYYTISYPADTRGRAYYTYDAGGRVTNVEHYWDDWGGSGYSSTPIIGNHCDYELSGSNRGLKVENEFYVNNSGSWALDRTETYGYDADLDYLTSADYDDGLANETPSWSYDAAGNRNDATVVDNLNRATTIGGVSRTYDILGNTLAKGSTVSYGWDVLNRMTSFTSGSTTTNYQYRADGMRTKKVGASTTDLFYYDGQVPVETAEVGSASTVVTRNSLGARAIDRIERSGSSTTVGYPLYDGHGNMIATLAKSGGSFSIGDARSYDAWGVIRSGNTTGDPKGRYVANLGHVDDDESGLTYMRARYYEAGTGRFLISDRMRSGYNWYAYCSNNPVSFADESGNSEHFDGKPYWAVGAALAWIYGFIATINAIGCLMTGFDAAAVAIAAKSAAHAIGAFTLAIVMTDNGVSDGLGMYLTEAAIGAMFARIASFGPVIHTMCEGSIRGLKSSANVACVAIFFYSLYLLSYIVASETETSFYE